MSKKPSINIFLKIIYWFLKGLVLLSIRVFYGKVEILNAEGLKFDGPCILVSNHPSTMMDPLHIACRVDHIVHFLANASLFQTKFTNWFFNTFFCIPVARKKDVTKIKIDNENSFQRAFDFLLSGGCLYIAPEGLSTQEHDLKPLKTGTARVALGTEAQNEFKAKVKILPVGIYYENAQRFRHRVLLNVGEPIPIAQYKADYEQDDRATVHKLTDDIEQQLSDLLIVTNDPETDQQFRLLERIRQAGRKDNMKVQYNRSQQLAAGIRDKANTGILSKAQQLLEFLKKENLSIEAFGKRSSFTPKEIITGLFAPFGWLLNIIPALVVFIIHKMAKLYDGYTSTVLILSGLIFFPIFYRLNNWVLSYWIDIGWWWPLTWVAYGILGIWTWNTFSKFRLLWHKGRFRNRMTQSMEARDAMALYLQVKKELVEVG